MTVKTKTFTLLVTIKDDELSAKMNPANLCSQLQRALEKGGEYDYA